MDLNHAVNGGVKSFVRTKVFDTISLIRLLGYLKIKTKNQNFCLVFLY